MSEHGPLGQPDDENPFGGMPFFGDLARLASQLGSSSSEAAKRLALSIATGGTSEPNVDPIERIQLEQLVRVADLHIAQATGLSTSVTGKPVSVLPVNRTVWVERSTDAYRPLFEELAQSLSKAHPDTMPGFGPSQSDPVAQFDDDDDDDDPLGLGADADALTFGFLQNMMQLLGPTLVGLTAGSMLGHLARRFFGQYDLPIPRPPSDELLIVVPNVDEFGNEWSLPLDDLKLWVCLHEVAFHATLGVPHVRARLEGLLHDYASSFEPNPDELAKRFDDLDLDRPETFETIQQAMGDPELILGVIQSQKQRELLPRLEALTAVLVGYVDHVMDTVGKKLIGSYGMLTEALRRRRVTADPSDRFVEQLIGLELSQGRYDRGAAFVGGVIERAGEEGLARLWHSARELPTPAEVDAPGLWLARIDLDDH